MQKIVSYPLSAIYYLLFGLVLVIFHPIQWICYNVFGYKAHKITVDYMNLIFIIFTRMLGTTYKVSNRDLIPENRPIIFVANHQSMYDIISMVWYLRKFHPKFVSKAELGKGIPSVSYNLRKGGSVLIDRNQPKQAIPAIKGLGQYIQKYNRAAAIFPEGTRSKTGKPKPFAATGIKVLMKAAPDAYVVPLSINNSWKMMRFGFFPVGLGNHITIKIHPAIAVNSASVDVIIAKAEADVVGDLKYNN